MRALSRSLAIGIVLAAAGASPAAAQAPVPALVTEVTSGTTLNVQTSTGLVVGVRLIGIDAPSGDECGADDAWAQLEELALGRAVQLVADPAATGVGDGRSTYYVDRDDGLDVGLQMLRLGASAPRSTARAISCAGSCTSVPTASRVVTVLVSGRAATATSIAPR